MSTRRKAKAQRTLWEGVVDVDVRSLWEPWIVEAWRTGCEGRISVLKRRHGLSCCLYRGTDGMKRWVGLGVLADNLINMGKALSAQV